MKTGSEKLRYFKDKIFDLLNDTSESDIKNIEPDDKDGVFKILLKGRNRSEIESRQILC